MSNSWQEYKAEIEQRLKVEPMRVYGNIGKSEKAESNEDGWMMGLCPFHRDTSPSFAFNVQHLGWACFAGCGKGDVWDFITITSGRTFKEAITDMGDELGIKRPGSADFVNRPPIKRDAIEAHEKELWESKKASLLDYLRNDRGLADETIKLRRIGWSSKKKRYVIPVFDEKGVCWNLRLYSPTAKAKMINHRTNTIRYGKPARLYGLELLAKDKSDFAMITEGEFDSMLAVQFGIMAVSGTHGCGTFNEKWVGHFKGKKVALFYDQDEEGKRAVNEIVLPHFKSAVKSGQVKSVSITSPPLAGTKDDKDITDWVVKRGCTPAPFKKMVHDSPVHVFEDDPQTTQDQYELLEKAANNPPIPIRSFAEIDRTDLIGKRVSCEITVCSESKQSYFAAEEFRVRSCILKSAGRCALCSGPIRIPHGARDFIGSCMSSDAQVSAMLARNYCSKGQRPQIEVTSKRTVREFLAHQKVSRVSNVQVNIQHEQEDDEAIIEAVEKAADDKNPPERKKRKRGRPKAKDDMYDEKNNQLVERNVYYLSDKSITPGNYYAEGWVTDRPQDQGSTFLIDYLEPQEDDYESFDKNDHIDDLKAIDAFSMEQIVEDIRNNVTRVYERDELLLATLMAYLSPRFFNFNGERLRGWMCMAIIGDVGTAKTKTFSTLAQWIDVGDVFSSLTGSRTGLAYSIQQAVSKSWHARIGRYPANSRKLLMVDEIQLMRHEELKPISKAMDEGVLKIDRVVEKTYESQTRVIFIGNPKQPQMDNYQLGCQALKQVFPIMIIRRLDLVVLANRHDVTGISSILHQTHEKPKKQLITADMLRSLVYLMWKIRPEQIVFTDDAVQECMKQADVLSEKFGSASPVPLVANYEIDKKLARLAIPIAALDGSFDDEFETLTVEAKHVGMTSTTLDMIYSAENFQLDTYSEQMKIRESVEDYDKVVQMFDDSIKNECHGRNGSSSQLKRMLFSIWSQNIEQDGVNGQQASISRNDIVDSTGLSKKFVSNKMQMLKSTNLISSSRHGYEKTPKFARLFRRLLRDRPGFFDEVKSYSVVSGEDSFAPRDDDGHLDFTGESGADDD